MTNLDYRELEKKLGRKLTRQERKVVINHEHAKPGLPSDKMALAKMKQKTKKSRAISGKPAPGGAPGLGKKVESFCICCNYIQQLTSCVLSP